MGNQYDKLGRKITSNMPTEALNGLKKGDRVRHVKSKEKNTWYQSLNNGTVEDVSLSRKTVYVKWVDGRGRYHHWAGYKCEVLEKIGGDPE
ncbi:hypothetical protein [Brevibacillus sp. HD1.4A]|uniref:hypothetical protein n=1 Tax=Brevibacillus sp. HD1.4A TaxID=2738978 RepID=UPI00156AEBEB|nr:hypothetical protein [Brevibacillus sp. HD1.4A]NRQ51964.1 hypothetical protein [Brevibacillus sp. HD1.4A]